MHDSAHVLRNDGEDLSSSFQASVDADVAPAGSAHSLNIVLDGYYRDNGQGTGISTYSRVMFDALNSLGHTPAWLFGRENTGNDAVTQEVTFYDPPVSSIGAVRALGTARRLWRGVTQTRSTATRLQFNGVVQDQNVDRSISKAFNVPGLYRDAMYGHELLGRFREVKIPEPVDVFHLTAPLPVKVPAARKSVVTIADLVPLRFPNTTLEGKGRFISLLRDCASAADLVMTVSEASKADIVEILNVHPDKVEVTHLASDLRELSRDEISHMPRVLERFGLQQQQYLLFVSAIEPKKNLRRLIDAYLEIDTDIPLVIAGRKAWLWEEEIGDLDIRLGPASRARLRFLNYVPRRDLRFLYAGARMSAFPSLCEGFGLPALEAMKMGCPLLVSDIAALNEVCGEAALKVDPYDSDDIRKKLELMLGDDALRRQQSAKGLIRAQAFSYDRFVEQLGRAYRRLV